MKKYFVKENFLVRPEYSLLTVFFNPGIFVYNHEEWRETKRFTMKALKSIGFGRTMLEPTIHLEIDYFLKCIGEKSKSGPFQMAQFTGPAASNVVSQLILGERYDYEHPTRKMFDKIFLRPIDKNDYRPVYLSPMGFVKWTKLLLKLPLPAVTFWRNFNEVVSQHIKNRVEEIRKNFNLNDEPSNYIECCLKEIDENKDNIDFKRKYFDDTHMIENCFAFFAAGSGTTQEYLEWWFVIMANFPEVQEKMRTEVDLIVGNAKASLSMKNLMPYTEAVLAEVHRFSSLVGLNAAHIAYEDSDFGPYFLPAGTQIILNLNEIHHDPDNFERPDDFLPERFLSEDGKKFIRSEKLMPYGYGKRTCAGEALAQAEIFLFTTSTLQKFIIKTPNKWNGKTFNGLCTRLPEDAANLIVQLREDK